MYLYTFFEYLFALKNLEIVEYPLSIILGGGGAVILFYWVRIR